MKHTWFIAVAVLGLAGAALPLDSADAQQRGRGGRVVSGQINTPRGTGDVTRTIQNGEGRRRATTETTGPNGRTRSLETEQTADRENGTFGRRRVYTGPNGQTRSVEANSQRNEDGSFTFDRTATNPNGETRTQSGQGQVTQLENGRQISGTYTTPNGDGAFNRSNTVDENGVRTIAADRTGPNGATSGSTTVIDREAGTLDRSSSQTGPNGATRSTDFSKVRTDAGFDVTRTVTDPNGETRTQTGSFAVAPLPEPAPANDE